MLSLQSNSRSHSRGILRRLLIAVSVLALLSPVAVSASSTELDKIPYSSYTYWSGYSYKREFPTKDLYAVERVLTVADLGTTDLRDPQHMICDPAGDKLYILDSGNGRVLGVSLTEDSPVEEITSLTYQGEEIAFTGARGVYADAQGNLYIADTENERVLVLDASRQITNILTCPVSDLLPEDFRFRPTRLAQDTKGYLYILSEGCYYGALAYDKDRHFCGFFGANVVESDFLDALTDLITSFFETDTKREASLQKLPTEFTDIAVTADGFLCTLSSGKQGQIRKLGPKGTNNLSYATDYGYADADDFNFGDLSQDIWRIGKTYAQTLNSLTIDEQGFLYMLDSVKGRVYVYDEECRLLSVFGGGLSGGEQKGTFRNPVAITAAGGRLYVLDFLKHSVTVLKATEYGQLVMTADVFTLDGEYEQARPYWEKVLTQDKNSQIAYKGLARAAFVRGDYDAAMTYAKAGLDKATYANAFEIVSGNYLKENFLWIAALVLLVVGGLVFFALYTKKRSVVLVRNEKLRTCLHTVTHPFEAFNDIKYKGKGSVWLATAVIVVYFIAKAAETLCGGFMYVGVEREEFNILFSILGSVGVLLLWVIVNWAVCILLEGKGRLKEIYCVSAYCMLPQIISSLLFIALSHIVVASSFSSLAVLSGIFTIYTVILLLVAMTVVHEFDFFRSMGTAVLTVCGMMLAAFLIFICFMLVQDLIGFVVGIVREAALR